MPATYGRRSLHPRSDRYGFEVRVIVCEKRIGYLIRQGRSRRWAGGVATQAHELSELRRKRRVPECAVTLWCWTPRWSVPAVDRVNPLRLLHQFAATRGGPWAC